MARILIVDDAVFARMRCAKLLTEKGFEIYEAANGEEALSQYMKALDYNQSPLILINIAKTVHKMGNYEEAKTYYLSAVKKDKRFEQKYAYLGMGAATELRASDRAKIDIMVEWDYQ